MLTFVSKMGRHSQSTGTKILARIRRQPAGHVFSAADFHDLGSPTSVRLALMRHTRKGDIRKLSRGLYDRPRQLQRLKRPLPPVSENVVQAMQARDHSRLGVGAALLQELRDVEFHRAFGAV